MVEQLTLKQLFFPRSNTKCVPLRVPSDKSEFIGFYQPL